MTPLINHLPSRDTLHSAARFMMVGMLGTLIDLSLFVVLNGPLGLPTLLATTVSYSAGIINNYLFHRNWTFANRAKKTTGKQFSQFAGISLSALALNNLIVMLLAPAFETFFHDPGFCAVLAKVCAIGAGVIWNFLANHYWTFRSVESQ